MHPQLGSLLVIRIRVQFKERQILEFLKLREAGCLKSPGLGQEPVLQIEGRAKIFLIENGNAPLK